METELVVKKPEVQEDTWAEPTPTNPVTVVQGSGDREWASITFKAGTGYNAPWLVLKPSSMEEAQGMVNHEDLSELLDQIARKNKEFEKAFGGAPAVSKPAASSGGWGAKKPAAKPAVSDDAPECEHGERTWVDKGAWRAWMCPAERDDPSKCDPIWANEDGSPQPAKKRR